MDIFDNKGCRLFIDSIIAIETEEECKAFLEDLMTRKELGDITQRLEVAKLLSERTVYNKIVEETGASTATISRVNRSYIYGRGGYDTVFAKLDKKNTD